MYRGSYENFKSHKRRKRGNNLGIIILKFILMDDSKGFLNKEEVVLDHFCPILNVPDFLQKLANRPGSLQEGIRTNLQLGSSSICHATPLTGSLPEGSGAIP